MGVVAERFLSLRMSRVEENFLMVGILSGAGRGGIGGASGGTRSYPLVTSRARRLLLDRGRRSRAERLEIEGRRFEKQSQHSGVRAWH